MARSDIRSRLSRSGAEWRNRKVGDRTQHLREIQRRLLEALVHSDVSKLRQVHQVFSTQFGSLVEDVRLGHVPAEEAHDAALVCHSVATISTALVRLDEEWRLRVAEATSSVERVGRPEADDALDLQYDPWRRWFLGHLEHPYPTAAEKAELLADIGGSLSVAQLNTWFTNARRRSGWQEVYKAHGGGSELGMRSLVRLAPDALSADARDALDRVRVYFEEGGRDRVGDWLDGAIAEGRAAAAGVARVDLPAASPAFYVPASAFIAGELGDGMDLY